VTAPQSPKEALQRAMDAHLRQREAAKAVSEEIAAGRERQAAEDRAAAQGQENR